MKRRLRWANPFYAEHYLIETRMNAEDCSDALRSAVVSRYSPKTWLVAREEWPAFGAVRTDRFWMRRIHTFQRSYFLQEASGVIGADDRGSLIQFRVGMSPSTAVILTTTLGFLLLAAVVLAVAVPGALAPWPAASWLAWPAVGAAFVVLDRLWWADDDVFLVEFILRTVSGTRAHPERLAKRLAPGQRLETPS
jgi:hypothetical protein